MQQLDHFATSFEWKNSMLKYQHNLFIVFERIILKKESSTWGKTKCKQIKSLGV